MTMMRKVFSDYSGVHMDYFDDPEGDPRRDPLACRGTPQLQGETEHERPETMIDAEKLRQAVKEREAQIDATFSKATNPIHFKSGNELLLNEKGEVLPPLGSFSKATTPNPKDGDGQDPIRTFETGATRDTDEGKFDYEGFLSPAVLFRFAAYMHRNRRMRDGSLRASDNWQKGIPQEQYVKSLFRHFHTVWWLHRKGLRFEDCFQEALCGVIFNAMGLLFEALRLTGEESAK
jgi:hypothetical protein